MASDVPKRHHFVPRMLQKRFGDGDGRIWAVRKSEGRLFRTTAANLFVEGGLYRRFRSDGSEDTSLEIGLSRLESQVDPIVDAVVAEARRGALPPLSARERKLWDLFLYLQMKRIPRAFTHGVLAGAIDEHLDRVIAELLIDFPDRTAEIRAALTEESRKRLAQNARVGAIANRSELVTGALAERGLYVLRLPRFGRKQFIIGDVPVARLGLGGLSSNTHEVWLPVAPDVAVGIGPIGSPNELFELGDHSLIRHLNRAIVEQSELVASGSDRLLTSLTHPR